MAGKLHEKALLLCKVVAGTWYKTKQNMDSITQPPAGYHSIYGIVGGLLVVVFQLD